MKEYQTVHETVADDGTFVITGRVGRTITLVLMIVNGTGTETVDATLAYVTAQGDSIVCAALTQVTAAAGAPTQLLFNEPETPTITFPIVINAGETLTFTCDSSAAGAMYFDYTILIES